MYIYIDVKEGEFHEFQFPKHMPEKHLKKFVFGTYIKCLFVHVHALVMRVDIV